MFKKADMGIGMLILFIAGILVASVAAGVVIRSTGLLQQRSLEVEESSRERLVNRLEIISIDAICNTTTEQVFGLEFLTRLGAGSYALDMNEIGFTFQSDTGSAYANYFDDDVVSACSFDTLIGGTEFCFTYVFGDTDNVLKDGELIKSVYKFNETLYLNASEDFVVSFVPTRGAITDLYIRAPKVINKYRTRLRS